MIIIFWQLDQFLSTFGKKCIFPFENPKTLKNFKKLVLEMQNVMHIATNAGYLKVLSQLVTHGQNPLFSLSDSFIGCFIWKKVTNKQTNSNYINIDSF